MNLDGDFWHETALGNGWSVDNICGEQWMNGNKRKLFVCVCECAYVRVWNKKTFCTLPSANGGDCQSQRHIHCWKKWIGKWQRPTTECFFYWVVQFVVTSVQCSMANWRTCDPLSHREMEIRCVIVFNRIVRSSACPRLRVDGSKSVFCVNILISVWHGIDW